jgi:hypothetical protein
MKGCLMKNNEHETVSPLEEALHLSRKAVNVVYKFQSNESHMPSSKELLLLDRIEESFELNALAARHFNRNIRERIKTGRDR